CRGAMSDPYRDDYSEFHPASSAASAEVTLAPSAEVYSGSLTLDTLAFEGYVRLWVDEAGQRRETVADYLMGGNPGKKWGRTAPIISADGQVILFGANIDFNEGEFFTIQFGKGYWIRVTQPTNLLLKGAQSTSQRTPQPQASEVNV